MRRHLRRIFLGALWGAILAYVLWRDDWHSIAPLQGSRVAVSGTTRQMTFVYDIRDLIIDIPDFSDAPGTWNSQRKQNGVFVDWTSGRGLFGGSGGTPQSYMPQDRQDRVEEILSQMPQPSAQLNGWIIVTTTPAGHEAVLQTLNRLRNRPARQRATVAMIGFAVGGALAVGVFGALVDRFRRRGRGRPRVDLPPVQLAT